MTLKRRIRSLILAGAGFLLISGIVMASLACGSPPEQQGLDPAMQGGSSPEEQGLDPATQGGSSPEEQGLDPAMQVWSEIIPEEGTATAYGISLSLDNTQQFIDWYNSVQLSAEQLAIRDMALSSEVAPCCDEYPMSTCCCECNLAQSVWGLSAYLITEKDYRVSQVQEAALQWLHFIRPDYYVASALEQKGMDPGLWGFTAESTCFSGNCDRPFHTETSDGHLGGCGGMEELIQA